MILYGLLYHIVESRLEILRAFKAVGVDLQALGHSRVQHYIRAGDAVRRAEHAEFELVAGEGERRSAVAVGRVAVELRQHVHPELHLCLFGAFIRRVVLYRLEHGVQLVSEEHGYDSRRGFVGSQTVIVARRGDRDAQQILIIVDSLYDGAEEQQELGVLVRRVAGRQQVLPFVGAYRPVVVLAGTVHAGERLLVEQADQSVLRRDLLHDLHRKLVVVGRDVRGRVDRRQLMLGGSHLVVLGLGHHAELPQLLVQVFHIRRDSRLDRPEVVIVHLLAFGRSRAEQGPAAEPQVGTGVVHLLCYKEIFLLRTHRRHDALCGGVAEQPQHAQRLSVQRFHRPQERSLLVERMAAV